MTWSTPPEVGDLLNRRAAEHPDKVLFTHLTFDGNDPQFVTYGDLYSRACKIATLLKALNLRQRPVLLIYPPGADFAPAFFGVLLARAIAVPAPFPALEGHFQRLDGIAVDCAPGAVMSTEPVLARLRARIPRGSPLRACPWVPTDGANTADASQMEPGARSEIALLQYTSGSTARPRGVMITHGNLAHNLKMIERAFQLSPGVKGVSWLPHFHDMGLISGFIAPLVCSGESILMSPDSFLRRPLRWLEAISHYHGQVCGAPNFAYDLCSRWAERGNLSALDLSTWRTAFVGAEPVRFSTMQTFADRFRGCGFRKSALTPCYGMAEATVLVSCKPPRRMPVLHTLSRSAMEAGQARPSTEPTAVTLMGSGNPAAETTVRIVDPNLRIPLGSRCVGEVWISGPQVARGYWGRDDDAFNAALADSTEGPFLRTGDLGFLTEAGELVFVERLKDIIVYNGLKYACHDLELTAGTSHAALSPDKCVAVSFDLDEKPHLVVIAELPKLALGCADEAARAIRAAWFTTHGLSPRTIVFVARGRLSRTTSGKLQRRLNASRLAAGAMRVLALNGDALPGAVAVPESADNFERLDTE